jgi:hypothetical protein
MTQEELKEYTTSHQRQLIFKEEFAKKGYYYEIFAQMIDVQGGPAAMVEVRIYQREADKIIFRGNGFAMEEKTLSEFNNFHFFATAQTKAISRALASIGIGIENNLATLEDVTINSYPLEQAEKKASKKAGLPKVVSIEDTLMRLRVKYDKSDGKYVVRSKKLREKTVEVLKRYGFKKDAEGKLCAQINEEDADAREQL